MEKTPPSSSSWKAYKNVGLLTFINYNRVFDKKNLRRLASGKIQQFCVCDCNITGSFNVSVTSSPSSIELEMDRKALIIPDSEGV
jgi:hypothetical protein